MTVVLGYIISWVSTHALTLLPMYVHTYIYIMVHVYRLVYVQGMHGSVLLPRVYIHTQPIFSVNTNSSVYFEVMTQSD